MDADGGQRAGREAGQSRCKERELREADCGDPGANPDKPVEDVAVIVDHGCSTLRMALSGL